MPQPQQVVALSSQPARRQRRRGLRYVAALALLGVGCLPYGVRGAARPLPEGTGSMEVSFGYLFENLGRLPESDPRPYDNGTGLPQAIIGYRRGLSQNREFGMQVILVHGVSFSLLKQLTGDARDSSAALSAFGGAGVLEWGNRLMFQGGLVRASRMRGDVSHYAGVQSIIMPRFLEHGPALSSASGFFVGRQKGRAAGGRAFELGVFYVANVFGRVDRRILLVPSFTPRRSSVANPGTAR